MIDLPELERLEREATPGPWHNVFSGRATRHVKTNDGTGLGADLPGTQVCVCSTGCEAALIVAARNALPTLLKLAREHARMKEALEFYANPENYVLYQNEYPKPITRDGGEEARDALKEVG